MHYEAQIVCPIPRQKQANYTWMVYWKDTTLSRDATGTEQRSNSKGDQKQIEDIPFQT